MASTARNGVTTKDAHGREWEAVLFPVTCPDMGGAQCHSLCVCYADESGGGAGHACTAEAMGAREDEPRGRCLKHGVVLETPDNHRADKSAAGVAEAENNLNAVRRALSGLLEVRESEKALAALDGGKRAGLDAALATLLALEVDCADMLEDALENPTPCDERR